MASTILAVAKPGFSTSRRCSASALVHEAWLRLAGSDRQRWRGRDHFFSAAAEAMRRILVENARRKQRIRHGGGMQRLDIVSLDLPIATEDEKCLQVDEYLGQLAEEDPKRRRW